MKQYFEIQSLCYLSRHVINISSHRDHAHTLLFLHVREVLKCQRPHWRSPESIRLHYCLQPSPAQGIVTEKAGRRDMKWQRKQVRQSDYAHEKKGRKREGEFEETRARKKEQVFTVHINLGDVSSLFCTWLPFLCDLLLFAELPASALAVPLNRQ